MDPKTNLIHYVVTFDMVMNSLMKEGPSNVAHPDGSAVMDSTRKYYVSKKDYVDSSEEDEPALPGFYGGEEGIPEGIEHAPPESQRGQQERMPRKPEFAFPVFNEV